MTTMNGSTSRIHGAATSVVRVNAHSRNTLDRSGLAPIAVNATELESSLTQCSFEMTISRNAVIRMQREGSLKGVDSLSPVSAKGEDFRLVFEVEVPTQQTASQSSQAPSHAPLHTPPHAPTCGGTQCVVRVFFADPSNRSQQHTLFHRETGCWLEQGQWLHVDLKDLLSATLRRAGSGNDVDLVYLRTTLLADMGFEGGRYEPVRTLIRPALAGSSK